jgi:hypothetical protein
MRNAVKARSGCVNKKSVVVFADSALNKPGKRAVRRPGAAPANHGDKHA